MNISEKGLTELLETIKEHDQKMTASVGTFAARRAEAKAAVLETVVPTDDESGDVYITFRDELERAELVVEMAKSALADVQESVNDAVTAHLKASKSETGAELEAMKTERDGLVTLATSIATILRKATKPVTPADLGIAKSPKGSGSSSSGGTRIKSTSGAYSYKRDDEAEFTFPCEAQQSLSSIAFRVFNRAPVGDLKAALAEAGVTSLTQSYSATVTVNGKTATVSFEITPPVTDTAS